VVHQAVQIGRFSIHILKDMSKLACLDSIVGVCIKFVHDVIILLLLLRFYGPLLGLVPRFFSFLIKYTVSRILWTRDRLFASLYLHTEKHKHRINVHNTDIEALSEIRTHDPRVRVSEDSSCHCDRRHNHKSS
jgi:hypothetical protein